MKVEKYCCETLGKFIKDDSLLKKYRKMLVPDEITLMVHSGKGYDYWHFQYCPFCGVKII